MQRKISTRQIRGLMTRSPWRMFATYVKGRSGRSASAAGDSYVPHALEGRSISVMRSENEKQKHQWAISSSHRRGRSASNVASVSPTLRLSLQPIPTFRLSAAPRHHVVVWLFSNRYRQFEFHSLRS